MYTVLLLNDLKR